MSNNQFQLIYPSVKKINIEFMDKEAMLVVIFSVTTEQSVLSFKRRMLKSIKIWMLLLCLDQQARQPIRNLFCPVSQFSFDMIGQC